MSHLNLTLLGAFQATLDNEPLTNFHSVKVQALLAYLVLEADRPHPREALMALLWPDDAPQSAQQSLRQALYALRRALGDTDDSARVPFLLVTRQTVQFNPVASYTLDVAAFLRHLDQAEQAQAVALYPAALLAGLVTDSTPFEEWLRTTRAYLHNLMLRTLSELTQRQLDIGNLAQANQYARRQLALEPWREEAHRQLMTALALSGERSAALAQYATCCHLLAKELSVEPEAETTALYEQIRLGRLRPQAINTTNILVTPPVNTPLSFRHNLPPQPTAFIGRTKAAQRIWDEETTPPDRPNSTIQNPKFVDGTFFVALASVASPDLLVSTIAITLDLPLYGSGDLKTQLLDYLKTRSLLLVFDNCEHLLDGIDLVSDVLAAAPGVKVLATSREPLNLREEWLHPLSGMSFPTTDNDTASLEGYSAVQFFVQCARQMKSGFDLAAEAAAVVHICRLVDGMPLGIELATASLKFYACTQIAAEITHSLDFLTTTLRNIPARHRSMRAVFEHSWALLALEEQAVFARLAVFQRGFQLEAAQQVADATRPLLLAFVEKSLLQMTPSGRFQLHELVRQFVEEKLLTQPEALLARQK